jgi:hypothetical protein
MRVRFALPELALVGLALAVLYGAYMGARGGW